MSGGSGNSLDFLHLLMVPLTGVIVWLARQLNMKADKIDMQAAMKSMEDTVKGLVLQQQEHHKENTRRLDNIHQTQLDIVGGRYDRSGRER